MKYLLNKKYTSGFTVVELLIVIVVIGILSAVILVAYNGVQKNATLSVMKETLHSVATKMKLAGAQTETYISSFPSDIKVPEAVGIALTVVQSEKEFCINSTSQKYTDMQWSITQDGVLKAGLCAGAVIAESIIGNYNADSVATPQSNAGLAIGDGGGFKVTTNKDWTSLAVEWDAVADATKYDFQYRSSQTGTWYYTNKTEGTIGSATGGTAYTNNIPAGTTSYNWPIATIKPSSATHVYEYRVRPTVGGVAGAWYTAVLYPPTNATMPAPASLNVSISGDWAGLTVSWSGDVSSVPSHRYEFQYRNVTSGAPWYLTQVSNGQGGYATTNTNALYTGAIPGTTSSYSWPSADIKPTAGGHTYEYRIRAASTTLSGIYSPWTTTSLTTPANETLPSPTSLTVTQTNNWAGLDVAWTGDVSAVPQYRYEFQYRSSPTGTWYLTQISNGQGGYATTNANTLYTGMIPGTVSSYSWPSANIKPTAGGQTYEYRIRAVSGAITNTYGGWTTATLSR